MRTARRVLPAVAAGTALLLAAAASPAGAAGATGGSWGDELRGAGHQHSWHKGKGPKAGDVLAEGLNAPLGLAVDGKGNVYVAESFDPGADPEHPPAEPFVSKVSKIPARGGDPRTVYEVPGGEAAGVDATRSRLLVAQSTGFNADGMPSDTSLATLTRSGDVLRTTSILAAETKKNPDQVNTYGALKATPECLAKIAELGIPAEYPGIVESHPYAVAALPRGGAVVADAAANAIWRVSGARVRTVAVLPPVVQTISPEAAAENGVPECANATYRGEPVPTDVEVGRDGRYYVSTLPGFPEQAGKGSVWRINPWTGSVRRVATGFTSAVDLAVAKDGTIYVAELFANQISKISRSGKVTKAFDVPLPGAVEVTGRGAVYATSNALVPGGGSVVVLKAGR